ncbi:MAG: Sec-independent protein translocase subunit TatA [Herbiconiux sp.]|nr:Sec-independent protein translocase subunit TatA [Herbiconiux sp.]
MLGNLNGWHLVIILVVVLLLFGATRLPALSKSLGQSMRIFRSETKAMKEENGSGDTPVATAQASTPETPAAPPVAPTAPPVAPTAPPTAPPAPPVAPPAAPAAPPAEPESPTEQPKP